MIIGFFGSGNGHGNHGAHNSGHTALLGLHSGHSSYSGHGGGAMHFLPVVAHDLHVFILWPVSLVGGLLL